MLCAQQGSCSARITSRSSIDHVNVSHKVHPPSGCVDGPRVSLAVPLQQQQQQHEQQQLWPMLSEAAVCVFKVVLPHNTVQPQTEGKHCVTPTDCTTLPVIGQPLTFELRRHTQRGFIDKTPLQPYWTGSCCEEQTARLHLRAGTVAHSSPLSTRLSSHWEFLWSVNSACPPSTPLQVIKSEIHDSRRLSVGSSVITHNGSRLSAFLTNDTALFRTQHLGF